MKMMQGRASSPARHMSRTRDAPTPTKHSTKSEPEMVKKEPWPRRDRAAAASCPCRESRHEHAFGNLSTELLELARVLEEVDDLGDFLLGLIDARDIRERDVTWSSPAGAHGFPNDIAPRHPMLLHLPQHVDEYGVSTGAPEQAATAVAPGKFGCFGGRPSMATLTSRACQSGL